MKDLNMRGKQCKNEQYHSYKGEVGKVAENILNRDFTANKPFEKLATDVTQFKVCNDKVYLSPVMDLYNREIVAYSILYRVCPGRKTVWTTGRWRTSSGD